MKELSICMTHYNRKFQLMNTLRSIESQNISNDLIEIVIVDDVSDVPLKYSDFEHFNFDIKLLSIHTKNKWWVNPCVGFNIAFNLISGKKTIIQNAECMHITPIIEYVVESLEEKEYIAISTLSLSKESTMKINEKTNKNEIDTNNSQWYCHPIHRPDPFNFCAAIHTKDLIEVGGFDNKFANGFLFDDDAFILQLKKNGIKTRIEDSHLVYHQWHAQVWQANENMNELIQKNKEILDLIKLETNI